MASSYTNFGGSASGGGAPSGAAGGDLSGTYPNPSVGTLSLGTAIPVTTAFSWGSNLPTVGTLRYGNTQAGAIWRNAANSANVVAIGGVDATNVLWIGTTQAGGSRPDITFIDATTDVRIGVGGSGRAIFANGTITLNYATVATATAGAGTLPATPEDFLTITTLSGVRKIPMYNV